MDRCIRQWLHHDQLLWQSFAGQHLPLRGNHRDDELWAISRSRHFPLDHPRVGSAWCIRRRKTGLVYGRFSRLGLADAEVSRERHRQSAFRNTASKCDLRQPTAVLSVLRSSQCVRDLRFTVSTQLSESYVLCIQIHPPSSYIIACHSTRYKSFRGRFLQARWLDKQRQSTE